MQHKTTFIRRLSVAFLLLLLIPGIYFFFEQNDGNPETTRVVSVTITEPVAEMTVVASGKVVATGTVTAADTNLLSEEEPVGVNPFHNQEVKARLVQIADVYAEQIKYPAFSVPVADRQALKKYLPAHTGSSLPLSPNHPAGPILSIKTDKTAYFTGEPVSATVTLTGMDAAVPVLAEGRLVRQGQTLAESATSIEESGNHQYKLVFDAADALTGKTDGLRVIGRVTYDGVVHELGTAVRYSDAVAEVTHVDDAEVQREYLYIPVAVETKETGYHEIGANLYSAETDQPLIHLSAQKELLSATDFIPLKAHISALKLKGSEGPYLLKDIQIYRMPSSPDFQTKRGSSRLAQYTVNGFAFSDYEDVPYINADAQARLEFLRGISQPQ